MELIRGLHNLRDAHRGCVATIGNFDGVHLGHQAVLGQVMEKSAQLTLPAVVIVFEPYPQEYFSEQKAPPRLTRFCEKMEVLRHFSVDRLLYLAFNHNLSQLSAAMFIRQVLVDGLGIRYLVVGDDFRFGHQRQGNFALLQQAGAEYGFQAVNMHTFEIDNVRVSSTRIRQALAVGDMVKAASLLGRTYRMSGKVVRGEKLGRELGYPTANIHLHRKVSPIEGIFAVEVFGLEREPLPAVASVGNQPTVGGTKTILEVYLFDFDQDIYGRHLQVSFLHKFRDQIHFDSLQALSDQIENDVQQTKIFFQQYENNINKN